MRRGTASRKRRLGTSYRDGVSRRRSVTRSNQLPSCQLRLCLRMPSVDNATLHTWLHHWQDEFDAAYLYLVLAGQESDPHRKDVYIKLAGVEERHTQMWRSEEHTSELQSLAYLVCRLLLEKKKKNRSDR